MLWSVFAARGTLMSAVRGPRLTRWRGQSGPMLLLLPSWWRVKVSRDRGRTHTHSCTSGTQYQGKLPRIRLLPSNGSCRDGLVDAARDQPGRIATSERIQSNARLSTRLFGESPKNLAVTGRRRRSLVRGGGIGGTERRPSSFFRAHFFMHLSLLASFQVTPEIQRSSTPCALRPRQGHVFDTSKQLWTT
jgi:hypothetical protein